MELVGILGIIIGIYCKLNVGDNFIRLIFSYVFCDVSSIEWIKSDWVLYIYEMKNDLNLYKLYCK